MLNHVKSRRWVHFEQWGEHVICTVICKIILTFALFHVEGNFSPWLEINHRRSAHHRSVLVLFHQRSHSFWMLRTIRLELLFSLIRGQTQLGGLTRGVWITVIGILRTYLRWVRWHEGSVLHLMHSGDLEWAINNILQTIIIEWELHCSVLFYCILLLQGGGGFPVFLFLWFGLCVVILLFYLRSSSPY